MTPQLPIPSRWDGRLYRKYERDDGPPIEISINRRGCREEWTAEDEAAMEAIARAAMKQFNKPEASQVTPDV